ALGRVELAADVERQPVGPGGEHPEVVLPLGRAERLVHHFGHRPGEERLVEVAPGAMPDGAHHPRWIRIAGDDHLQIVADSARPPTDSLPGAGIRAVAPATPAADGRDAAPASCFPFPATKAARNRRRPRTPTASHSPTSAARSSTWTTSPFRSSSATTA